MDDMDYYFEMLEMEMRIRGQSIEEVHEIMNYKPEETASEALAKPQAKLAKQQAKLAKEQALLAKKQVRAATAALAKQQANTATAPGLQLSGTATAASALQQAMPTTEPGLRGPAPPPALLLDGPALPPVVPLRGSAPPPALPLDGPALPPAVPLDGPALPPVVPLRGSASPPAVPLGGPALPPVEPPTAASALQLGANQPTVQEMLHVLGAKHPDVQGVMQVPGAPQPHSQEMLRVLKANKVLAAKPVDAETRMKREIMVPLVVRAYKSFEGHSGSVGDAYAHIMKNCKPGEYTAKDKRWHKNVRHILAVKTYFTITEIRKGKGYKWQFHMFEYLRVMNDHKTGKSTAKKEDAKMQDIMTRRQQGQISMNEHRNTTQNSNYMQTAPDFFKSPAPVPAPVQQRQSGPSIPLSRTSASSQSTSTQHDTSGPDLAPRAYSLTSPASNSTYNHYTDRSNTHVHFDSNAKTSNCFVPPAAYALQSAAFTTPNNHQSYSTGSGYGCNPNPYASFNPPATYQAPSCNGVYRSSGSSQKSVSFGSEFATPPSSLQNSQSNLSITPLQRQMGTLALFNNSTPANMGQQAQYQPTAHPMSNTLYPTPEPANKNTQGRGYPKNISMLPAYQNNHDEQTYSNVGYSSHANLTSNMNTVQRSGSSNISVQANQTSNMNNVQRSCSSNRQEKLPSCNDMLTHNMRSQSIGQFAPGSYQQLDSGSSEQLTSGSYTQLTSGLSRRYDPRSSAQHADGSTGQLYAGSNEQYANGSRRQCAAVSYGQYATGPTGQFNAGTSMQLDTGFNGQYAQGSYRQLNAESYGYHAAESSQQHVARFVRQNTVGSAGNHDARSYGQLDAGFYGQYNTGSFGQFTGGCTGQNTAGAIGQSMPQFASGQIESGTTREFDAYQSRQCPTGHVAPGSLRQMASRPSGQFVAGSTAPSAAAGSAHQMSMWPKF